MFGERFTFSPKLQPKGPDLPLLSSRLISHRCAPRNRHRGISKISLLARNILRRVICLKGWVVKVFLLLLALPHWCCLRFLYYFLTPGILDSLNSKGDCNSFSFFKKKKGVFTYLRESPKRCLSSLVLPLLPVHCTVTEVFYH